MIPRLMEPPYETAPYESLMFARWAADMMWIGVPVRQQLEQFISTLPNYPMQEGQNMNPAGFNYNTFKAMQMVKQLETVKPLLEKVKSLSNLTSWGSKGE